MFFLFRTDISCYISVFYVAQSYTTQNSIRSKPKNFEFFNKNFRNS